MKTTISYNEPININNWNKICKQCSNLLQTTYFDEIELFYKQTPIYVEIYEDTQLIGGVKYYFWQSTKNFMLKKISGQLSQFGEFIYSNENNIIQLNEQLQINLSKLVKELDVTTYTAKSFYGGENLLTIPPKSQLHQYLIGYIDTTQTEENLWSNIHSKHRNVIRKAEKNDVYVNLSEDIDCFIKLLKETYKEQEKKAPNEDYIKHNYRILQKISLVSIYFAIYKSQNIMGSLLYSFGSNVYYAFGGGYKNNLGAGNYLHWDIIKQLHNQGIKRYYLGEIAKEFDSNNIKFSEGISTFKKRFGVKLTNGYKATIIYKPIKFYIWQLLIKIIDLIHKK